MPSAREPFLAAARVLLAEGIDPETMLELKHAGSDAVCLTARLGFAAMLTVVENSAEGPRFARYQPFERERAFPSVAVTAGGPRDVSGGKGSQNPPLASESAGAGHDGDAA